MIRFITAAAVGLGLTCAYIPPALAATTVVVKGFDFNASNDLLEWGNVCGNPEAGPPDAAGFGRWHSTAAGAHVTGWDFGQAGYEAGVQAWVPDPNTLHTFTAQTYRAAEDPDGSNGHLVAYFDHTNQNFQNGYFVGMSFADTTLGTWGNLAGLSFNWYRAYGDGTYQDDNHDGFADLYNTLSIPAFTVNGNGSGLWVGPEMGCDGQPWYLRSLTLGTASRDTTYTFERARAQAYLSLWPTGATAAQRNPAPVVIDVGKSVTLLGDAMDADLGSCNFDAPLAADSLCYYVAGSGTLHARAYGAAGFTPAASGSFGDSFASFPVAPKHETTYFFASGQTVRSDASNSRPVTVLVRSRIKGKVPDKNIYRGERLGVKGKLTPGNSKHPVSLQRYVRGKWRTIAKSRTRAGGKYSLMKTAPTTGRWKLRVVAADAKGNLGNKTRTFTVSVKPRPRPKAVPRTEVNVRTVTATVSTTYGGTKTNKPVPGVGGGHDVARVFGGGVPAPAARSPYGEVAGLRPERFADAVRELQGN